MSKILMESLKMDLPGLAELIRSKGRGKDTMLAHITPKEAALLKRRGGSGSVNPDTGLPEFEDSGDYSFEAPAPVSPVYDVVQPGGAFTQVSGATGQQYTPGGADYAPTYTPTFNVETYGTQGQPAVGIPGPVPQGQELPTGGTVYAPTPLTPLQLGQAAVGQQVEGYPGPKAEAVPQTKDISTQLKDALTPGNLARLGLVGALGAYGANVARKAGTQTQAATQEQKAIAQPYTAEGQKLVGAAQRGELTPASQQVLAAYKAQQAQGVATRGGVGQQQADAATAALYSNLLDNQYKYGLQVMQIGDNIALGAIRSGLQLDNQLQATTNNFYSQLASIAAGGSSQIPFAPGVRAA